MAFRTLHKPDQASSADGEYLACIIKPTYNKKLGKPRLISCNRLGNSVDTAHGVSDTLWLPLTAGHRRQSQSSYLEIEEKLTMPSLGRAADTLWATGDNTRCQPAVFAHARACTSVDLR